MWKSVIFKIRRPENSIFSYVETITFHLSGKKPRDIFLGDRIDNVKEIDFEIHLGLTKHDPQFQQFSCS